MLQRLADGGTRAALDRSVRILNRLGPVSGTVMVAGDPAGLDRRFAARAVHPATVVETLESFGDGTLTGAVLPNLSAGDTGLHGLISLLSRKLESDGVVVASLRHYGRAPLRREMDRLATRCGLQTRFLTRLWPPVIFVLIPCARWEIY